MGCSSRYKKIPKYHKAAQVKENEVGGMCGTNRREEKMYKVLVGKRPLRRQRHRREHGIRIDVGEIGCGRGGEFN
jgi:hypothetical protein